MRTILVILAAVAVCLAIDGATTPYNFSPATKAYSSQVNANFDSLRIPLNKMKDTLNLKMVRYAKVYRNHDSTFQWMNIDTVKGPVWVDTLRVDTVRVGRGISVAGPLVGSTGSFTSWLYTADSVLADRGVVTLGPVKGATGVFTGTLVADSIYSTKVLSYGAGISATTGTFSGTVGVDSLRSTKGIKATTGTFSGTVGIDSLKSTKGINATTGIFSGKVTATDSIRTNGSMQAMEVRILSLGLFYMTGDSISVRGNGFKEIYGNSFGNLDTLRSIQGGKGQLLVLCIRESNYPVIVKAGGKGSSNIHLGAATRTLDSPNDRLVLMEWNGSGVENDWFELSFSDNN